MRRRDLDWFIKTLAVAMVAGVMLYPALQPGWPRALPEEQPAPGEPVGGDGGRTSQAAGQALAKDLFEDKGLIVLLTAVLLVTALIGGIFLAREDTQDKDEVHGTPALRTARGPQQVPLRVHTAGKRKGE